jgi:hypothetical protein
MDNPEVRAWSGYAFEQICMAHLSQIKHALGIGSVQTQSSVWQGCEGLNAAQVDLVIDRRDQAINLCEMKFSINRFVIDKAYAESLRQKISELVKRDYAFKLFDQAASPLVESFLRRQFEDHSI